jgi:hypothetical protein
MPLTTQQLSKRTKQILNGSNLGLHSYNIPKIFSRPMQINCLYRFFHHKLLIGVQNN